MHQTLRQMGAECICGTLAAVGREFSLPASGGFSKKLDLVDHMHKTPPRL